MQKTILVIDDDESITEVVRMVLEGEGYRVQTHFDGDYFLDFKGDLPDLILLDVLLLGKDGRDICKHLKSDARTAHIPVIMLSAHSDASSVADVGGADGFLEKPFDLDVLLETVMTHLSSGRTQPPLGEEALG